MFPNLHGAGVVERSVESIFVDVAGCLKMEDLLWIVVPRERAPFSYILQVEGEFFPFFDPFTLHYNLELIVEFSRAAPPDFEIIGPMAAEELLCRR
jgi:hypothetical protein